MMPISIKKEIHEKRITTEEYHKTYTPTNGYILIQKDETADIVAGRIFVPRTPDKEGRSKYASTGIVVGKSNFLPKEYHDVYIYSMIQIGDRVGFNGSFPVAAPVMPNIIFDNPDRSQDRSFTIHSADLVAFLSDDEEEKKILNARIERITNLFYPDLFKLYQEAMNG